MGIQQTRLDNGMVVLTDPAPFFETLYLGIWVKMGSRHETTAENGMFHFIEHTLFKGTARRKTRDIAEAFDGIGGVSDAYTGKEETCYSIRVRAKHLEFALEILADMLQNPLFDPEELDRERAVILEEIQMEEDDPEGLVYDRSVAAFWPRHALGHPILGTPDNVAGFDRDMVRAFHHRYYTPDNMVVSASGKVDHDHLCALLTRLFPPQARSAGVAPNLEAPQATPFQVYEHATRFEQTNFTLTFGGLAYHHPKRDALYVLSTLLGGGMSSRLFQKVREESGLAYNIGAYTHFCSDSGYFSIYGNCRPRNFEKIMGLCVDEIKRLKQDGVTEEELLRAREQYISSMVMSMESTGARASALARNHMLLNEVFDLDRSIADMERVDRESVNDLAGALLTDETLGLYALGRFKKTGPDRPWSVA